MLLLARITYGSGLELSLGLLSVQGGEAPHHSSQDQRKVPSLSGGSVLGLLLGLASRASWFSSRLGTRWLVQVAGTL